MTDEVESDEAKAAGASGGKDSAGSPTEDLTRDNEESELEAEQESAEAMDADVPHAEEPPGASETTEGQPS